ncbi:MAG: DNA recombination/repair protein RecA [Oscillospiraceae bacterium]|nr:DNA recombination/repair protein RecA [Oscillospiraceae bacterium]
MKNIEKMYGEDSIMRLGDPTSLNAEKLLVEDLFRSYTFENKLDIVLSYQMPQGYEDAFGTFDITAKTLFLNLDVLASRPRYEAFFYLLHELRHSMQYLHPEVFDVSIQKSLPYVVLYSGECFKLVDGVWKHCRLEGSEDYFTRAYENLPYEADANRYAYETVKKLLPGDADKLEKLYSAWRPKRGFTEQEYHVLFEKIDESI